MKVFECWLEEEKNSILRKMASMKSRKIAIVSILCFEAVLIILFSIFVKYDPVAEPFHPDVAGNSTVLDSQYPMFQDIHVMIFIGFGFLMTFLRKYAFSALGLTFFVAALVMQWGLLCHGFFRMAIEDGRIHLSIFSLINADVIAGTVLISFGALIGKVSPIQLIIMALMETIFFTLNEFLCSEIVQATDTGGSMYVHAFGAYFGLAVSFALSRSVQSSSQDDHTLNSSIYQSDINAMLGSLFLWVFWPSFNAALVFSDERHRTIINTYLALTASCLTAFATSSMVSKVSKFEMVHIQNATLAGGVCIGTTASMMVQPYGALLIGCIGGVLATLGYHSVQDFILQKLHIHDTCGVNNLHGMPGIAAGIIGAVVAAMADTESYGTKLHEVFPAMGPPHNRTPPQQAGYQLLALLISFLISTITGLITGLCIRNFKRVERMFDDEMHWTLPESGSEVADSEKSSSNVKKF